ncbi:MAG TPA: hypothetical protein VH083_00900, partial [Myxococcales bacterium]|nr:hypothetical protein [Myxococcales bacterium]
MSCGGNTTSGGTSPDGGQQPVSQPLTVSLSGSGSVSSTPAGIDCGATCSASFASGAQVTLHATPAVGNVFSGWSGGCSGSGDCSVTMSAAVSVAAAFVKAQVRLTVSKQDGGDVTLNPAGTSCGTGCSTYDYGTSVTVTVSALTGHSASLSGGGCASTPCTIALTSDTSVSASFPLVKVKLNEIVQGTGSGHFVIDPIGASCGNGCLEYDYGTQVSINAVADTGSDQTGLTIPGCHTTSCQLTGDITVVAVFTLQELNYTAALSGTGTGSFTVTPDSLTTCSGCFAWNYGTTVTITGIPSATSDFDAVSFCNGSSCSSCDTQPCSFVATESGTFTAAFKLKTVHLSITTAGRGQGSVKSADGKLNCGACTADYTYGDQVKLSTTTITGFQGWGGACSGQGLQCTLTMAGDQSVEGDFNNRGIFLLSGAPSLLFRFDPAFDSTLLGGINPQVPGGLAWLPTTGTLYGGDGSSTIFSFDPFSGSAIGRGSDGGFNIEGFTWSPTSSSFYGVSVGSPDKLFKLSLDSGDPVL